MLDEYAIVPYLPQEELFASKGEGGPKEQSCQYGNKFFRFLEPLLRELHVTLDKRPVRTLVQAVEAIVAFRDQNHGLLLSELGAYMDGLGKGGGTKRLGTLIHHPHWKAQQIEEFLLRRADEQMQQWQARGEEGLLIWDGTVLEKPESRQAEGLCAVRSSKALRLTQVKKGYYYPPRQAHLCTRTAWHGFAAGRPIGSSRTAPAGVLAVVDVAGSSGPLRKG